MLCKTAFWVFADIPIFFSKQVSLVNDSLVNSIVTFSCALRILKEEF